jgi:hypothetical protein
MSNNYTKASFLLLVQPDETNRDLVAQLKTMNGKLDNIDGKFENRITLSRVQLAAILGIAAIGGTVGPLALKMIGLS